MTTRANRVRVEGPRRQTPGVGSWHLSTPDVWELTGDSFRKAEDGSLEVYVGEALVATWIAGAWTAAGLFWKEPQ